MFYKVEKIMNQYEAAVPVPDREEEEYIMLVIRNPLRNPGYLSNKTGGTKKDNFDESVNNFAFIFRPIEWL